MFFSASLLLFFSCQNSQQQSKLLVTLPSYVPTPDGMAIDPATGDLIVACPNYSDISQPAVLIRVNNKMEVSKWVEVPIIPETGVAAPMGIVIDDDGTIYICDNQGWRGTKEGQNMGRIIKFKVKNNKVVDFGVIAHGMEHPNGIKIKGDYLYVTQSMLSPIKDASGLLVSGVNRFHKNDRNLKVNNDKSDKSLLLTVVTNNKDVQYGLDGIAFDKKGDLYVGNFGDGSVLKYTFNKDLSVNDCGVWAKNSEHLATSDGINFDDKGNLWIADFSANAVAKVTPDGTVLRVAESLDCDGSKGGLDQPGEPILWNGKIVLSCFDAVTDAGQVNCKHDKPHTLAYVIP